MLVPPGVGAALTAPSCRAIDRFLGYRCTRAVGHQGEHSSGQLLWGSDAEREPAAPPAPPPPTTALERVLRIAARTLPCSDVNPGIARLDRIAFGLRNVRAYYLHDVETCSAIDAWLELYEGSR